MENKINIAELLKDCPQGMELDCPMFRGLEFVRIDEYNKPYPIICRVKTAFDSYNVHTFTEHGSYGAEMYSKCVIFPKGKTTWEGFQRPFRDGDVLVHTQNERFIMSIYKSNENEKLINTHVIFWDREEGLSIGMQICCYTDSTRFATDEEKQRLFDAIKAKGYHWNAETKTLEKLVKPKFNVGDRVRNKNYKDYIYTIHDIVDKGYSAKEINADSSIIILFGSQEDNYELVPNKFDITTLKPFDKVLVRCGNSGLWTPQFFAKYRLNSKFPFECTYNSWTQCIPYEGNEHLLGTTDDCNKYYKTWE